MERSQAEMSDISLCQGFQSGEMWNISVWPILVAHPRAQHLLMNGNNYSRAKNCAIFCTINVHLTAHISVHSDFRACIKYLHGPIQGWFYCSKHVLSPLIFQTCSTKICLQFRTHESWKLSRLLYVLWREFMIHKTTSIFAYVSPAICMKSLSPFLHLMAI